jgi:hypothetical protein
MTTISIHDLRPTGADLFDSSESYLQELSDTELSETNGGSSPFCWTLAVLGGIIVTTIIDQTRR